jgi:cytochrome c peroxidase
MKSGGPSSSFAQNESSSVQRSLPARAPEPADNPPTPAKITLGRLLFFDPILSATQTVACATCHHPKFTWADRRATPRDPLLKKLNLDAEDAQRGLSCQD